MIKHFELDVWSVLVARLLCDSVHFISAVVVAFVDGRVFKKKLVENVQKVTELYLILSVQLSISGLKSKFMKNSSTSSRSWLVWDCSCFACVPVAALVVGVSKFKVNITRNVENPVFIFWFSSWYSCVLYSTCFILRVFYDIQVFCLFNFRYTHTQNTQHIPTVGRPRIHNSKLFFSRKNVNRILHWCQV